MNRSLRSTVCLVFLLWLGVLIAGCGPITRPANLGQRSTAFVPPTSSAPPTPTPAPAETPAGPSENPSDPASCQNVLTFVSDLTIPDGTVVSPDATMDKRWEVENSGTCNWSEAYRVRLIAGEEMGAQTEQALYPARSGTRATVRILFKAPLEPGSYRSAWQAFNPEGEPFGDPFFIDIVVEGNP